MRAFYALLLIACAALTSRAADLTGGSMFAVPTPGGKAPVVDGDLSDWDFSAAEPIWIAPETAKQMHGQVALMYDDRALYYAAKVSLPSREFSNRNNPIDPFWNGDVLEMRLVSDLNLPWPVAENSKEANASGQIAHLSFWKNSET